jgi:syntaxin 16
MSMSQKKDSLSTRYIELFNSTNHLYEELRQNYVILQQEQQKRIIPKFDDGENRKIDKKIKELVIEMTRKVRQADENINVLNRLNFNSRSEEEVKDNMKLNLVTKMKEFSRDFQMNEEEYMKKYQELVGSHNKYDFEDLDGSSKYSKYSHSTHDSDNKNDFLQLNSSHDKSSLILFQRDEEINTLLGSITELAGVFKDLQTLVQNQGTILDRIDYNIDTAAQNVVKANENLDKTEKMMRSNCYRNAMLGIIISIFIMGTLILLKFTK